MKWKLLMAALMIPFFIVACEQPQQPTTPETERGVMDDQPPPQQDPTFRDEPGAPGGPGGGAGTEPGAGLGTGMGDTGTATGPGMGAEQQPGEGAGLAGVPSFEELDTDRSGYITREQAEQHPQLGQNFERYDMNQDGQLDRSEFAQFEEEMQAQQGMQPGAPGMEGQQPPEAQPGTGAPQSPSGM